MIRCKPFATLDIAFLYLVEVAAFNQSADQLLDDAVVRDRRPTQPAGLVAEELPLGARSAPSNSVTGSKHETS